MIRFDKFKIIAPMSAIDGYKDNPCFETTIKGGEILRYKFNYNRPSLHVIITPPEFKVSIEFSGKYSVRNTQTSSVPRQLQNVSAVLTHSVYSPSIPSKSLMRVLSASAMLQLTSTALMRKGYLTSCLHIYQHLNGRLRHTEEGL